MRKPSRESRATFLESEHLFVRSLASFGMTFA